MIKKQPFAKTKRPRKPRKKHKDRGMDIPKERNGKAPKIHPAIALIGVVEGRIRIRCGGLARFSALAVTVDRPADP